MVKMMLPGQSKKDEGVKEKRKRKILRRETRGESMFYTP